MRNGVKGMRKSWLRVVERGGIFVGTRLGHVATCLVMDATKSSGPERFPDRHARKKDSNNRFCVGGMSISVCCNQTIGAPPLLQLSKFLLPKAHLQPRLPQRLPSFLPRPQTCPLNGVVKGTTTSLQTVHETSRGLSARVAQRISRYVHRSPSPSYARSPASIISL